VGITLGLTIAGALAENIISLQWLPLADRGDSNFLRGAKVIGTSRTGFTGLDVARRDKTKGSLSGKLKRARWGDD